MAPKLRTIQAGVRNGHLKGVMRDLHPKILYVCIKYSMKM